MRKLGCLGVLLAIGVLAGELWVFLEIGRRVDDYVLIGILAFAMSYAGVRLTIFHATRLPLEMMTGNIGGRFVALIGGVLLAFPGLCTGVIGLLLQIPLVQRLFARPAGTIATGLVSHALRNAMGGTNKFAGMFPGMRMKDAKPDDRARFDVPPGLPPKGKPPKTYDTTAEPD